VEGHYGREFFLLLQELFGVTVSALKTRIGIERIGQLRDQRGIDLQPGGVREFLYSAPSRSAVNQHLRTADKGDFAMAELVQVLESEARASSAIAKSPLSEVRRC